MKKTFVTKSSILVFSVIPDTPLFLFINKNVHILRDMVVEDVSVLVIIYFSGDTALALELKYYL